MAATGGDHKANSEVKITKKKLKITTPSMYTTKNPTHEWKYEEQEAGGKQKKVK